MLQNIILRVLIVVFGYAAICSGLTTESQFQKITNKSIGNQIKLIKQSLSGSPREYDPKYKNVQTYLGKEEICSKVDMKFVKNRDYVHGVRFLTTKGIITFATILLFDEAKNGESGAATDYYFLKSKFGAPIKERIPFNNNGFALFSGDRFYILMGMYDKTNTIYFISYFSKN